MTKHSFLLVLSAFIATQNVQAAQQNNHQIKRMHWEKEISSQTEIHIENKYGDIRLRKSDETNFIYHAVSQFTSDNPLKMLVEENGNNISIRLVLEDPDAENNQTRADLAVVVPKLIDLDIVIEKGRLSSKTLHNKITARSKSSDMVIKSSKAVDLLSKEGDIRFTTVPHKNKHVIKLLSHSGNIGFFFSNTSLPKIITTSGGLVTTNSMIVLKNKSIDKRSHIYNGKTYFDKAILQTDTGDIQLIEIEQQ